MPGERTLDKSPHNLAQHRGQADRPVVPGNLLLAFLVDGHHIGDPEGKVQRGQSQVVVSAVPSDRTRGNGHALKHRRLLLNIRKHFHCEGDRMLAQVAYRGCRLSILEDIQKPSGHGPSQPAAGVPARVGQLGKIPSRGPFQPQPSCDSVVL